MRWTQQSMYAEIIVYKSDGKKTWDYLINGKVPK